MTSGNSEDVRLVTGLDVPTALSALQESACGRAEAIDFLIRSVADLKLGLDPEGRFFSTAPAPVIRDLLADAVVVAWEGGSLTDDQHDTGLRFLNRGEDLAGD